MFVKIIVLTTRIPKRPSLFQFKNEKRKTNFVYLKHSFSKIKRKMKNKKEECVYPDDHSFFDLKMKNEKRALCT